MTTVTSNNKASPPTAHLRGTISDEGTTFEKIPSTNVQYMGEEDTFAESEQADILRSKQDSSPRCVICNRACHSSLMLSTQRGLLCPACRPATFALTKTQKEFALSIGGPGFLFQFSKPESGFSLTVEVDHALYRTTK